MSVFIIGCRFNDGQTNDSLISKIKNLPNCVDLFPYSWIFVTDKSYSEITTELSDVFQSNAEVFLFEIKTESEFKLKVGIAIEKAILSKILLSKP